MSYNYYRTDHEFWRSSDPEQVFHVRTFERAEFASEARRAGQPSAVQVARQHDPTFEYMQGFTMIAPGIRVSKSAQKLVHGRWRKAGLVLGADA